jgi:hypothetical protein
MEGPFLLLLGIGLVVVLAFVIKQGPPDGRRPPPGDGGGVI